MSNQAESSVDAPVVGNAIACKAKESSQISVDLSLKKEALLEKQINLINDNIQFQLKVKKNIEYIDNLK